MGVNKSLSAFYLFAHFASMSATTKEQRGLTAQWGWPLAGSDLWQVSVTSHLCKTSSVIPTHTTSRVPFPHPTVSSIKSLMDVLALCHCDDSILICHCWISEKLKERRRGGGDILQVRRGQWQYNHGETLQREDFFSFFTRSRPKGVVLVRASSRRA